MAPISAKPNGYRARKLASIVTAEISFPLVLWTVPCHDTPQSKDDSVTEENDNKRRRAFVAFSTDGRTILQKCCITTTILPDILKIGLQVRVPHTPRAPTGRTIDRPERPAACPDLLERLSLVEARITNC
jgi:hypothetical protein